MGKFKELAAVLLLNLFLGTLYAWSVIARALEGEFGIGRVEASSVFSLATFCFVLAMLFAPKAYGRLSSRGLALIACAMAAGGMALAATVKGLPALLFGYGVLFGLANGVGYGLSLQVATQVTPKRRGLAVGSVVAAYAGGAIAAAPLLSWATAVWGIGTTLAMLAVCFLFLAVLCPLLLWASGATSSEPETRQHAAAPEWLGRTFVLLWIGYALGGSVGLLMIGHAAALVESVRGSEELIVLGAAFVAGGNWMGRFCAGWASDYIPVRQVLLVALLLITGALSMVLTVGSPATVIAALAVVGAGYGVLASAYPIAVGRYFGPSKVGAIYGKLFTAWGVAGIAGPWIAGWMFEATGSYREALMVAAAAAVVAVLVTAMLPRTGQEQALARQ